MDDNIAPPLNEAHRMPHITDEQYERFIEKTPYNKIFILDWQSWQHQVQDNLDYVYNIMGPRRSRTAIIRSVETAQKEEAHSLAWYVGHRLLERGFAADGQEVLPPTSITVPIESTAAPTSEPDADESEGLRFVHAVHAWFATYNPPIVGETYDEFLGKAHQLDGAIAIGAMKAYVATAKELEAQDSEQQNS